ncbi:hypothetical protein PYCCODRAFT_1432568 [Trametes coccinea BRFM310]|uniref:Uncharacterized protein n=1 Tax=Trametes coccinea (strain BRFM310) TaxID=1353009 RepID=A0A1Y2IXN5_TRAC3|nr:hypothetical protein PYCCODRAFT_1432568 [Trametes coccinea BRFM310]
MAENAGLSSSARPPTSGRSCFVPWDARLLQALSTIFTTVVAVYAGTLIDRQLLAYIGDPCLCGRHRGPASVVLGDC